MVRYPTSVPVLAASLAPFTAGSPGLFVPPVAGAAGVLLVGTRGHAIRVGERWAFQDAPLWGVRVATKDGFVVVDMQGAATWIDASGTRTTPGVASGPDPTLGDFAAAWDPTRETLVLFGGAAGRRTSQETWEWRRGEWRRPKVDRSPAPRSLAQMTWVPPLDGMLVTGGLGRERPFYDLACYRRGAWQEWAYPAYSDTHLAPAMLAFDPRSQQVIQALWTSSPRGLGLWRYAGHERWELAARVRFPTVSEDLAGLQRMQSFLFAFDPVGQAMIGVGLDNDLRPAVATVRLGEWLGTLPAVDWEASAEAPATAR